MTAIRAKDADNALAPNDFAVFAKLLNRCANFHFISLLKQFVPSKNRKATFPNSPCLQPPACPPSIVVGWKHVPTTGVRSPRPHGTGRLASGPQLGARQSGWHFLPARQSLRLTFSNQNRMLKMGG